MALEGTNVILREQRPEDLQLLADLRNDLDTQAWSKTLPPDYTQRMFLTQFEQREFSYDRDDGRFIIESKDAGEMVGYISYTGLEMRWDVTIGIMIAKDFWGSGLAIDALQVLLLFLFEEMGVRVVRLWTHTGNARAIGSAEKLGFKVSYRQRESIFKAGKRYDNVNMDMLREEYYTLHPDLEDNLPPL
ncbi:MAG: GNAT family N-acetyltransferase [Anaerolineales bacterium]|nr:GNAT family N-acetyltransferase [Chloroflexota bacterium]MBL6981297.1 GNAT family N-acetyltransferase [Anaerolineales bacterium]